MGYNNRADLKNGDLQVFWRSTQVGRRGAPAKGVGRVNRRESSNLSFSANKKGTFVYQTKVPFLNDVCLRQMMTASPNDIRFANDVWLRHILWQTSHHCGTKWRNIIFAKQMHHIAAGDASFDILTLL